MPQAVDAKVLKEADPRHVVKKKRATAKSNFDGQTFEALNAQQKDALLKELAIRAGLIDDSDD